jgi:hypothetical protein
MGKKKAAGEKLKAARENGFDDDMTGIDDRPALREILPYTDGLYGVGEQSHRNTTGDLPYCSLFIGESR